MSSLLYWRKDVLREDAQLAPSTHDDTGVVDNEDGGGNVHHRWSPVLQTLQKLSFTIGRRRRDRAIFLAGGMKMRISLSKLFVDVTLHWIDIMTDGDAVKSSFTKLGKIVG